MDRIQIINSVFNKYTNFTSWKDFYRKISEETNYEWSWDAIRKFMKYHKLKEQYVSKISVASDSATETISNNAIVYEYRTKNKPMSLDEVLDHFKVDKNTWKVDRYSINSWDVTTGKGEVYTNYQTKVNLVRIVPVVQTLPELKSVTVQKSIVTSRYIPPKDGVKSALIIGDAQLGYRRDVRTGKLDNFHDRLAMDVAVQIMANRNYDTIVILGDMLDLPSWSDRFLREPEFYWTTQPALKELYWWLTITRAANPAAEIIYLEGNHEKRLNDAVRKYFIEAYQLVPATSDADQRSFSIPNLLDLDSLNIQYVSGYPKGSVWLNDNLEIFHGVMSRARSGETSRVVVNDARSSKIFGHSHRVESASKTVTRRSGQVTYTATNNGCLCKIDGTVPSGSRQENWQQGVTHVYYTENEFNINSIQITNGKALFENRLYEGVDRVKEISADINWEL